MDWFFGFKLHLAFNDKRELLNFVLIPGNTDDQTPVAKLLQQLFGKVFALLGLHLSEVDKAVVRKHRGATDYQVQAQDEKSLNAFG